MLVNPRVWFQSLLLGLTKRGTALFLLMQFGMFYALCMAEWVNHGFWHKPSGTKIHEPSSYSTTTTRKAMSKVFHSLLSSMMMGTKYWDKQFNFRKFLWIPGLCSWKCGSSHQSSFKQPIIVKVWLPFSEPQGGCCPSIKSYKICTGNVRQKAREWRIEFLNRA